MTDICYQQHDTTPKEWLDDLASCGYYKVATETKEFHSYPIHKITPLDQDIDIVSEVLDRIYSDADILLVGIFVSPSDNYYPSVTVEVEIAE